MHSAERKTGFAYVLEEVDKWTGHPVWVLKRVNPFCMFTERTFKITLIHSCCLGCHAAFTLGNGRILHEVSSMTGLYGVWNGVATSWLGSVGGYPKQRLKRRLVLVTIWFIVTMLWSKFLIECQKLWGMFCSVTFILPSVRRLTPVAQRIRISHDQAMITRVFLSVKLLTCIILSFQWLFEVISFTLIDRLNTLVFNQSEETWLIKSAWECLWNSRCHIPFLLRFAGELRKRDVSAKERKNARNGTRHHFSLRSRVVFCAPSLDLP